MKKKAFTLIELIIVMGIISLIMSIMTIRFDLVKRVKEKNEINTILADINYCKEKARVTGFEYKFSIYGKRSYKITRAYLSSDSEISREKKNVDLEVINFYGYNNSFNEKNPKEIKFVPSGSVSNAQSITILGLYNTYKLSVGVSGANTQIIKKE
ncbi:MAG: pilus assembly FimT family protein [Anaerococcus sp.]